MIQIPYDAIIERILKSTSLKRPEVDKLVEKKKLEMKGLVSDEGAAYIVANDLGIKFVPENSSELLPLESVVPGLKKLSIAGRVTNVFPVRSFESKGRKGSVANFVVNDGSASVKIVLWNEMASLLENISVGDIIAVRDGYSKQGMRGVEVHLSNRSRLAVNPDGVEMPEVKVSAQARPASRDSVVASVTHIFDKISFFDVCPECRKKVTDGACPTHGSVKPSKNLVLSLNLDNGSEIVRAVMFGSAVNEALGVSPAEVYESFSNSGSFDEFLNIARSTILGKTVRVLGNRRLNDFSGRDEIVVNSFDAKLDPVLLIKEISN